MNTEILKKIISRTDLSSAEASAAMESIMNGTAGEILTASFLTGMVMKGETSVEIESFARAMKLAARPWEGKTMKVLADTCGTGGDSMNTINVSTLSALLLSSLGIPVAKHGNRAVSSTTGSADFLEDSGIRLELEPEEAAECLQKNKITFLFAPKWHPAMKHAGPVRKTLGFRTVFNILGPLTNPAPVTHQVLGVYSQKAMETMAQALCGLGRSAAWVVHSEDGLDEISVAAPTNFIKIENSQITERGTIEPEDFGFKKYPLDLVKVNSRQEAMERAHAVLEGKGSDAENTIIAMNAALVYLSVHPENDILQSASLCMDSLKSGKAAASLKHWAETYPAKH